MEEKILRSSMTPLLKAVKLSGLFSLFYLSRISIAMAPNDEYKTRESIRSTLRKHFVIPDVLSVAPNAYASVQYSTFTVNMGNKVDPRYAQHTPSVWWPTEEGGLYTLMMVDADVPNRRNPQYRCRQHWLVVNIPRVDIYNGKTLTEYIGPIAPKNSGLHRVVFLMFRQKGPIEPDEPLITVINRGPNIRTRFLPRNFSAKYSLSDPIAVNFFQVGFPIYQNKEERHSWVRKGITPPRHYVSVTNPMAPRSIPPAENIFNATDYTIVVNGDAVSVPQT
nr:PREDICTED: protein D1-like isoform X2 [Bemisia tabaci]XP_018915363.1 PREDICTED: protein D1-like isoform X2 [Bemisia tabaci]XP_018915364.1 PREDICTED: protein D1-like isoform X2 [Bemisia tabaci]